MINSPSKIRENILRSPELRERVSIFGDRELAPRLPVSKAATGTEKKCDIADNPEGFISGVGLAHKVPSHHESCLLFSVSPLVAVAAPIGTRGNLTQSSRTRASENVF